MNVLSILITLAVGIAGYLRAKKMKITAPGMLGSMILVALVNAFTGFAQMPGFIKTIAQALSGAYIGMQIAKKDIRNFHYLIVPFLILIALFTVNTFLMAFIISKLFKMDILTALLGCVPGGVSDMSMLALDMGGDAGVVALMQTMRFFGCLAIFPALIRSTTKEDGDSVKDNRFINDNGNLNTFLDKFIRNDTEKLVFTIIITLITGWIGKLSGFPAGAMVFPMFVVMFINVNSKVARIPKEVKLVAQILSGCVVGASITPQTVKTLPIAFLPIVLLLASYFAINLLFTEICVKHDYLDRKSAMFASAPGGATDMTLIAADLGADLTKIALIQVMRAAYVLAVIPPLITLFIKMISH